MKKKNKLFLQKSIKKCFSYKEKESKNEEKEFSNNEEKEKTKGESIKHLYKNYNERREKLYYIKNYKPIIIKKNYGYFDENILVLILQYYDTNEKIHIMLSLNKSIYKLIKDNYIYIIMKQKYINKILKSDIWFYTNNNNINFSIGYLNNYDLYCKKCRHKYFVKKHEDEYLKIIAFLDKNMKYNITRIYNSGCDPMNGDLSDDKFLISFLKEINISEKKTLYLKRIYEFRKYCINCKNNEYRFEEVDAFCFFNNFF